MVISVLSNEIWQCNQSCHFHVSDNGGRFVIVADKGTIQCLKARHIILTGKGW